MISQIQLAGSDVFAIPPFAEVREGWGTHHERIPLEPTEGLNGPPSRDPTTPFSGDDNRK